MSLKNAYREKMEAQLEEQRARLELLKAKAKVAIAAGKIMACEELADADEKLDALKAKLKNLTDAGGDAWQEMKGGFEKAGGDLSESCKNAAQKFKDER
jgi:prophage DNA circulation protein